MPSRGRAKDQAFRNLASDRRSPERDQELAGERYDRSLALSGRTYEGTVNLSHRVS
jgi:hypothetical protein